MLHTGSTTTLTSILCSELQFGVRSVSQTRLPPRGEERRESTGGTQKICVSTKRTRFIFADFMMHWFSSQTLTFFASSFANGFVFLKRTHLGGSSVTDKGVAEQNEPQFNRHVAGYINCSLRGQFFELFEPSLRSTVKLASVLLSAR
jgi:hypothetical protein